MHSAKEKLAELQTDVSKAEEQISNFQSQHTKLMDQLVNAQNRLVSEMENRLKGFTTQQAARYRTDDDVLHSRVGAGRLNHGADEGQGIEKIPIPCVSRKWRGSYKIPLPRRKRVCFCGERWRRSEGMFLILGR